ncbi:MAG: beta strand repeat-containing protein [Erythrobacter sp.]
MALSLGLLPSAASAQLLVNKSFTPANIPPAGTSTLTIRIFNNTSTIATSVNLTDNLPTTPTGLTVAPGGVLSNSCGGTVSAIPGSTTVTLTGGTVPAQSGGTAGECMITIQVIATPPPGAASYVNIIPTTNVSSSIGAPTSNATATLSVSGVNPITGSKSFSPTNIHGNGPPSRMRIQLNNSNGFPLTNVALTDPFPSQLELAGVPNVANGCGGTITAVGGGTSLILSGGTIPANSNCVIMADVVARLPNTSPSDGNATNRLNANTVTSAQGATNPGSISAVIRVQKGASVTKAFAPSGIIAGGNATLTITLNNFNATAITGINFTDVMPSGLTVIGPASTTCGGTAGFTATSLSVTGASLPAAPPGIGSSSCTISAPVTAAASGSYVNSVPAGNLAGISYNSASATLNVSSVAVTKAFSATSVPRTAVPTLTITLVNRNTASPATISSFTDNLSTMGANIAIAASPAASTTCGGSGTLTATPGTTLIAMTGYTIPQASGPANPGTCTITVPVQVDNVAATVTRTNTIAATTGLQTSLGNNPVAATRTLGIAAPLTVSTGFSPSSAVRNTVTRITVTISRTANAALLTNVAMTDPLPPGFVVAPSPNPATTCSGGTVAATPGATSFSLSGASLGSVIGSSASCTVQVNVTTSSAPGTYTNSIPVSNVTANTAVGSVSNISAANANINVVDGVSINKVFDPTFVVPGSASRITIFINNPSSIGLSLTGVSLTDNLPAGLVVQNPANATFTATSGTCAATITAVPGASSFGIAGGSISSGASCELSVDVTTNVVGTLNNAIPANSLSSTQGASNIAGTSASVTSSGNADVAVTKTDPLSTMVAGTNTSYTITITNGSGVLSVAGLPVVDDQTADLTFPA